jgi:hypothetical protein
MPNFVILLVVGREEIVRFLSFFKKEKGGERRHCLK